ncbi:hypothetical protein D3C77_623770 [compost metagenome]
MVLDDLAVGEEETSLDAVFHHAPGLAEQVGGHPVGAAAEVIGLDAVEAQAELLGATGEHAPHVGRLLAIEVGEHRIAEMHVRAVALGHGLGVQALEGLVEAGDEFGVGVSHGATPAGMYWQKY